MARPVGRRGETRNRVIIAALELFAQHGIGGTSLQMIADHLGLTKAAVYFQFQTKEDIILAVVQPAFDQMEVFLTAAESEPDAARRLELVVEGLVDLVLDHGAVMLALQGDPGLGQILRTHPEQQDRIVRLSAQLNGPSPDVSRQVAVAMVGGGLMLIGGDPVLRTADAGVLRTELLAAAWRLLRPFVR